VSLDGLYDEALANMERTVHALAGAVPQPKRVPFKGSFYFRHIEKTLHQALVEKLARMVSTLHAARLLMKHGFVQEQAALQRILDELQEDIGFLSFAAIFDDKTTLHQEYLDAFFQDEFDDESALKSTQKRTTIPRKKIHAYIARANGAAPDPSTGAEVARTVHKAYSGYVHGASPQIMDMYGGNPARFHMRGMLGTPLHQGHCDDLWNYFYRGIIAFGFAAKAFGDDAAFVKIREFTTAFEASEPARSS
jgi:hypothetical protein